MKKTHELRRKLIAWFVVLSMILSDAAPIFPGNAALADGEESVLTCGLTEHTHTEACYEDVLTCGKEASDPKFINTFKVHHHSDDCRNSAGELICGYVEDEYYHTHNEYCRNAEGKLVCGLETRKPHDHTDECYRTDRILICENNDQGHTHTAECYKDWKELTCGKEEQEGHQHTDECYKEKQVLTCEKAEDPGHTHTDECYTTRTELTCDEEHEHGEECYTTTRVLTCEQQERAGHTHSGDCYRTEKELICGKEERTGHHHEDACYTAHHDLICGQTERPAHVHGDECYKETRTLICDKPSSKHKHTEDCFDGNGNCICGKVEIPVFECSEENWTAGHTHSESCYDRKLICEIPEHIHTEDCWTTVSQPEPEPEPEEPVTDPVEETEEETEKIDTWEGIREQEEEPPKQENESEDQEEKPADQEEDSEEQEEEPDNQKKEPIDQDETSEDQNEESEDQGEEPDNQKKEPIDQEEESEDKDEEAENQSEEPDNQEEDPEDLNENPDNQEEELEDQDETPENLEEESVDQEDEPEDQEEDIPTTIATDENAPIQVSITYNADAAIPEGTEIIVFDPDMEQLKTASKKLTPAKSGLRNTALASDRSAGNEFSTADVSLEQWKAGENPPEIQLYHRILDISLSVDGEEIEPESPVTVSITLPDLEDGLTVTVKHQTENGLVELQSSTEGQTVTFITDGFSLFDFTSTAQKLSSWTSDLLENTFFGKTNTQETSHSEITVSDVTEGLTVLEAFTVTRSSDLWMTLQRITDLVLGKMESIVLYTVEDGRLGSIVRENISLTDVLRFSLGDLSSFALVKDTGFRHKNLEVTLENENTDGESTETGSVVLDGMMPKAAIAQAQEVSAVFDAAEFDESNADETTDENSAANRKQAETTVLAAYDIAILHDGETYQPGEEQPISVEINDSRITAEKGLELWHIKDDGTREQVKNFSLENGKIAFEATGFSVYALVHRIETYYVDADGDTYHITVEYGDDADLPEDVELSVSEADAGSYLNDAAKALETQADYLLYRKFLDISFVRKTTDEETGEERSEMIEPQAPVSVSVQLMDVTDGAEALQVVHFGKDGAEKLTAETSKEAVVTFTAPSFSVFGIGNVLQPLAATETENANIEILGFGGEASLTETQAPAMEEGLEVLGAFTLRGETTEAAETTETTETTETNQKTETTEEPDVPQETGEETAENEAANTTGHSTQSLWIKANLKDNTGLSDMESVVLYTVNGEETAPLIESLTTGSQVARLEAADVAIVKDTGYRHLNLVLNMDENGQAQAQGNAETATTSNENEPQDPAETTETETTEGQQTETTENNETTETNSRVIILDGMMPREAGATAIDVTEAYAGHEYVVEEAQAEETSEETAAVTEEESESTPADETTQSEGNVTGEVTEGTEETAETNEQQPIRTTLAAYDITLSSNESEYQPDVNHPITVEIRDGRITVDGSIELWHIRDDGTEERISASFVEDGKISFISYGFSAYAIVEVTGRTPWKKITSMDDFISRISQGVYPGHAAGNYFLNTVTNITNTRTGITRTPGKGKMSPGHPTDDAVKYYFEKVENTTNQYYAYCYDNNNVKKYVLQNSNSLTLVDESQKEAFEITQPNGKTYFYIKSNDGYYWNRQGDDNGPAFAAYNQANAGSEISFWYSEPVSGDPFALDGKSYGIMYWSGGVAGKAMMASSSKTNALDAKAMEVLVHEDDHNDKLFVPRDSDISIWQFHWTGDTQYLLSTSVDGAEKYLKIDASGLSLVDSEAEASSLQVEPGTGVHAGQIYLSAGNHTLTYSGKVDDGFGVDAGSVGNEWLNLVEYSELTSDYLLTYTATKISASDKKLGNGSKIVVYTRVWNSQKMRYDFYAVDHDGTLVPCYESGDTIQWIGNRVNTKLWNFVEYYTEGTTNPNYYYELYNPYSQNFIAPQVTGGQILSSNPIGINLDGRRKGYFYTPIIAWDETFYAYTGLKADTTAKKIVSCPIGEADDFYFAVLQDVQVDDEMTTVATVDNREHGIIMKIRDYTDGGTNPSAAMNSDLGSSVGGAVTTTVPNLLSTNIDPETGYPIISNTNQSLGTMYAGAYEVNHLFLARTYNGSGYFTYDSTQNFATLKDEDGNLTTDFTVYRELGTSDIKTSDSMKHGQFLPFNSIKPGVFTTLNPLNQYDALLHTLADGNPRKDEKLYNVEHDGDKVNLHFVVELEASFVQTPSGHDNWGHDIIYEFTGDDDFWLYVDGELVIDLGGIHSALEGKVNFATGEVVVNGKKTNLRELFKSNYKKRNPNATNDEVNAFLAQYFEDGKQIFRDYTTHTMKIFYMERGGGASNLNMRFNLSSVKANHVELSKKIGGADNTESFMAEFPYQIWYKVPEDETEYLLTQGNQNIHVYYKDTTTPVKYEETKEIDGIHYDSVFLLKPGEIADIEVPDGTIAYKIIECALNQKIYHLVDGEQKDITVQVNEGKEPVRSTPTSVNYRNDYYIDYQSTVKRSRAAFVNNVDPNAMRTLTIEKHLYDTDGTTELLYDDDQTTFGFRLSLASELDDSLTLADQYTYHILNKDKEYCRWDASQQTFVSLGAGKTDFSQLTDAEKKSATFTTSMNGSISKIPASYIVQIRELLVGTQYLVEERSYEIPDGYSLRDYHIYNDTDDIDPAITILASDPLQNNTVLENSDPRVVINNLKGFGIRMYKEWNDEDYMQDRAPTYFAVFTGADDTDLSLVDGTVRQLPRNRKTLYWYFDALKNIPFAHYRVREVTLSNENPTVDAEGVVTGYGVVTPIANNGTLNLSGTQKGESGLSLQEYTVQYEQGVPTVEKPNIRVDYVTNNREGLLVRKEDWEGNGLGETSFTLTDANYSEDHSNLLNATYTSTDNGYVTTAFLRKGGTYYLTETKSKQGFLGLQHPLTIQVDQDGHISVTGDSTDDGFYIPPDDTAPEGDPQRNTLTIKNKPYTFNVKKIDKGSTLPLVGARFELHKELTIGEYTNFDFAPMEGYTDDILITDANGIIPKLDETLPPGTYRLDETYAPAGYVKWTTGLIFTVNDVGKITLGSRYPEGTELIGTPKEVDNRIIYEYILKIPNSSDSKWPALSVRKKVTGSTADYDQEYEFTITFPNVNPNVSFDYSIGTETGTVTVDAEHKVTKKLKHGQTLEIVRLPLNAQITVAEETGAYTTTWKKNGQAVTATNNAYTFNLADNTVIEVTNEVPDVAPTNYSSRRAPYLLLLAFAFPLLLIIGGRGFKKRRKAAEADPTDENEGAERFLSSQSRIPCPQADLWTPGKRGGAG